ncbi:MAG: NAD(P)H-hydrate dehydratase [Chlorobiaceae bacterium]|jgi:ADP-dependent NAD(P)H-hydrate dehydratase / NAD(P)H-hydrate epimerase|nr:NAD(P)H-hydrate dehydratase [Chlorobiaceae bacterium]
MLPVVTAKEMQKADMAAISDLLIGETRLMELAGRECVRIICRKLEKEGLEENSFLVVCGKGNNGGDGFVIARHLLNLGATVDLVLLYPEEMLQGINREGFAILAAYSRFTADLRIFRSHDEALPYVAEKPYDAVIDAVTGTGLRLQGDRDELPSPLSEGIELVNTIRDRTGAVTFAVDIPSGLDATTGFSSVPSVDADVTVTMAFLKTGFFLNDGPALCGETEVAEISIPRFLIEPASHYLTDKEFAAGHFHLRKPESAKHTNGKVLIVAGSHSEHASMLGAAILSVKAAVKTGAGYVCISVPLSMAAAIHDAVPEAIVISRDKAAIIEKAVWADAIMIGCGLGRDENSIELIRNILASPEITEKKLVLDADALYALSCPELPEILKRCRNTILTPHYGEFSRLGGTETENIQSDPLKAAEHFARRHNVNVLLKGNPTVIAGPAGPVLLNTSGNEALATAGSGDVLAGMIAAIAAKGADIFNAGACAAWFHGRAGDLANDVSSLVSSGMVLDHIQEAILEIFELHE